MEIQLNDVAHIQGLSPIEIENSRQANGSNELRYKKNTVLSALKSLAGEPMAVLLLITATIYFISGDKANGIFLACSIILVAAISLYQDARSRSALDKLKALTKPACRVIRGGEICTIKTQELVAGDMLVAEEGGTIAADGNVIESGDFSVNEAIITGESLPADKNKTPGACAVYMGTTVATGLAIVQVTAVGNSTRLGMIGKDIETIPAEKSPLEKSIDRFVRILVIAGIIIFLVVWLLNYLHSGMLVDSLLKSLALAMSILPEEIPVAFTTFIALGARRLLNAGIIARKIKAVETLGSASVICVDKTGTITENSMALAALFTQHITYVNNGDYSKLTANEKSLVRMAMFASEPMPFDPMEKALHFAYAGITSNDERPFYKMVYGYPLEGKPPMMTHIFEGVNGRKLIAAKGAPEAIFAVCQLPGNERKEAEKTMNVFASSGYRVLGVAQGFLTSDVLPEKQQSINFQFAGLVAFYDPPKMNIPTVLQQFNNAGIKVKIITGDNALTAMAIAKQVGLKDFDKVKSGDEIRELNGRELQDAVAQTAVFTRVFPEVKMKIIEALKSSGHVVAMTGDGVNDAPALKAAHIGVAMGTKGTEIAKQSASLILVDDDLSKMVDAIALGRRINANLKKAIRYIISIHIPIILIVFIPLALGWVYPNIFTPVHVIFMELIMSPTCSIIYENEPIEKNALRQQPALFVASLFKRSEILISIIQGLAITTAALLIYRYSVHAGYNEMQTRAMVFVTLIAANIFLTLVNRSFYFSFIQTLHYRNNLVPLIIFVTVAVTTMLLYIQPFAVFFRMQSLAFSQVLICTGAGFAGVGWIELIKWFSRKRHTV